MKKKISSLKLLELETHAFVFRSFSRRGSDQFIGKILMSVVEVKPVIALL